MERGTCGKATVSSVTELGMLDAKSQMGAGDIAIVGMALRVPGAANVDRFWANLRNGVESIRDLSGDELLASGEDPTRIRHPHYVPRTADLPDMEMFDADFFGLSPKDAAIMDPQHRQFLECAWEALESAGKFPSAMSEPVGVFAGCGMGSYFYFNVCSNRRLVDQVGMFLLRHTGNDKDFLSTRASFLFDLKGPSVNIQTACSTSLVAVHYAVQSLLSGECDMALAGGVTIEIPHRRGYVYNPGEVLSPDGHCRPFDHRAAGTVFGSGAGVVVLRRLDDALRDGDIVHAVIKGTAINNDGGSKAGYLAPSVSGQAQAVVEAQAIAGVGADTIGYVECHGTGTYLGDPIEIEALSQAFQQVTQKTGYCYVGSVKSNIGHLDTAAGVVGLIKAALCLKHREIPPTLGFERPNPAIDFVRSPFKVCDRLVAWQAGSGPRRASVNSLGVGGTNAHVVLEEAPVRGSALPSYEETARSSPLLLLLSAKNRPGLESAGNRLKDWLAENPDARLSDVAHTLVQGRKPFNEWMVVAARDLAAALPRLSSPNQAMWQSRLDRLEGAVFMFPGGGAQHPGMAATLYREDKLFAKVIDEGLGYLPHDVSALIRAIWFDQNTRDARQKFLRPSLQLPAILVTEIALARLWQRHAVEPVALIGHSMGEYAAACVAGVLSFQDAMNLVHLRGRLFERVEPSGMLSIPLEEATLVPRLPEKLDLACVNAPSLCVVSGRNDDLEAFRATLAGEGVEASRLAIDIAAHSSLLDPILDEFETFLGSLQLSAPDIPIISNLTGAPLTGDQAVDPVYWRNHLRRPVRFAEGLGALHAREALVFVEVGPGRVLSSLAKLQGTIPANRVISSLPHGDEEWDDREYLISALGRAYAAGLAVDLEGLVGGQDARLLSLPTYPFQHRRYFIEPADREEVATIQPPLLKIQDISQWGYRPSWMRSLADPDTEFEPAEWLIFLDEGGLGEELARRLRSQGHRTVTVTRGDGMGERGTDSYTLCSELGRAGYVALLERLRSTGRLPQKILHMWLADAEPSVRAGSSLLHENEELGFGSMVGLGQAWADLAEERQVSITIVARQVLQAEDHELVSPERSLILGPALVLPKELPSVTVKLLDIGPPTSASVRKRAAWYSRPSKNPAFVPPGELIERVWEELQTVPQNEMVALRGERRFTQTHSTCPLPPLEGQQVSLRKRGVYLIAGGMSEVALALAAELAKQYEARLVLVARQHLPAKTEWGLFQQRLADAPVRRAMAKIKALEDAGAEVLYVAADVTDGEQMAAAVAAAIERFGEINGVLHCAGALDDGLVQMRTLGELQQVLSPKVTGLRVLHSVLEDVKLDFLILFSSTSTDIPRAGQVAYVAGNAYLNAYAQSASPKDGRRVVSLHWGVWSEVGLAARAVGLATSPVVENYPNEVGIFDRWIADKQGDLWLEVALSARRHWVLDEHRLPGGEAVLPGTAYVDFLAQAIRAYGLEGNPCITNLSFIRPFVLEGEQERRFRLRLVGQGPEFQVVIGSVEASTDQVIMHAEASVRLGSDLRGPLDLDEIRKCFGTSTISAEGVALTSAQEGRMRFGARWALLRSKILSRSEGLAELSLADDFRSDLCTSPLHPALLDIATGFSLELLDEQQLGDRLWVPASYGRIEVQGMIPGSIVSWVRKSRCDDFGDGFVAFDVTICDPQGNIIVDIEQFVMRRLAGNLSAPSNGAGSDSPHAPPVSDGPARTRLATQVELGIKPQEGFEALLRALALPYREIAVSSMELEALRALVEEPRAPAQPSEEFERPDLASDYVAPRDEVECQLVGFWKELLGLERVGVNDDFFQLGGHSLVAVRLFRMIRSEYGVDLPISTLFECPTVALCAAKITQLTGSRAQLPLATKPVAEAGGKQFLHLVPMTSDQKDRGTPLFICAGMFGNVLNLRHLALLLGQEHPVYGLQARGLYGDLQPHTTFEEMARDYLAEVRTIQPEGPYLLAGYSGGGLVALEMARQLVEADEAVERLVMFDTPLPRQPRLSLTDKALMKAQDINRYRSSFISKWLRDRQKTSRDRDVRGAVLAGKAVVEGFNNVGIEVAFRAAASAYQVSSFTGEVTLFRPRPSPVYYLPGGRQLQEGRNIILPDNGWSEFLRNLDVVEVPGDHDTMMLEPFVRVLAEKLRPRLPREVSKPATVAAGEPAPTHLDKQFFEAAQ